MLILSYFLLLVLRKHSGGKHPGCNATSGLQELLGYWLLGLRTGFARNKGEFPQGLLVVFPKVPDRRKEASL
jgi:hypothetical protein